jgi:hypothetical protein
MTKMSMTAKRRKNAGKALLTTLDSLTSPPCLVRRSSALRDGDETGHHGDLEYTRWSAHLEEDDAHSRLATARAMADLRGRGQDGPGGSPDQGDEQDI